MSYWEKQEREWKFIDWGFRVAIALIIIGVVGQVIALVGWIVFG